MKRKRRKSNLKNSIKIESKWLGDYLVDEALKSREGGGGKKGTMVKVRLSSILTLRS